MSSAPPPATPATPPGPAITQTQEPQEIRIISHSPIFYWWPVWAFGFLMAAITAVEHHYMVTVPPGTQAVVRATGELQADGKNVALDKQDLWLLDKDHKLKHVV